MKMWVYRNALKEAISSNYKQFKHGAIIERGGKIISRGINALKSPDRNEIPFSIHAEVAAIKRAGHIDLSGATLYSARCTATRIAMAKPCEKCMLVIRTTGIKEIVYSIDNNSWGVMRVW